MSYFSFFEKKNARNVGKNGLYQRSCLLTLPVDVVLF